ncbi:MAG TPA: flavodoxin domain-containing protein [Mycobacteriales bacterium]|nr:flavodoxin domain-containing protein [Mycobacteriales bacterium]
MNILVGYATQHGSTRAIAERIAECIAREGHVVDIRPVHQICWSEPRDAVVLGSAIHNGQWLADADARVRANRSYLQERPVWLFSVSCVGAAGGAFSRPVNAFLRLLRGETSEIAGYRKLLPVQDHRDFAGVVEAGHWPPTGRLIFRLFTGRFGDHRDWADIETWARMIVAQAERSAGSSRPVRSNGPGRPPRLDRS